MNIDMSPLEMELVRQVLSDRLNSLRQEARRTDASSFKEDLKDRETLLRQLLARLPDGHS